MKIGFIDYYLDEFHANNYPKWIKNALAEGETAEFYAWAEIDSPHGDRTTEQWCADNGVTRLGTMREVCETCDFLFLLSPDDPQNHLPYAETILPYQKPVFIDKTFAPDTATAKQIIALAEKHNTPFFSSSSLRFAEEYADISHKARSVIAHGSGWNFEVELIHPIEICACLVGNGAVAVSVCGNRDQFVAELRYPDDRQGAIHYTHRCEGLDYGATVVWEDGSKHFDVKSDFFQLLTNNTVEFFRHPENIPVSHEDILEGIRIRDGILKGLEQPYTWITLDEA